MKPDRSVDTTTKSSLSKGAEAGIGVGVGVAAVLFFLVLVYLLRKRSQPKEKLQTPSQEPFSDTPELPQGRHYEKAEFPAISNPGELDGEVVSGVMQTIIRNSERDTAITRGNETASHDERHELQ